MKRANDFYKKFARVAVVRRIGDSRLRLIMYSQIDHGAHPGSENEQGFMQWALLAARCARAAEDWAVSIP
jgi:hypothetical protein